MADMSTLTGGPRLRICRDALDVGSGLVSPPAEKPASAANVNLLPDHAC